MAFLFHSSSHYLSCMGRLLFCLQFGMAWVGLWAQKPAELDYLIRFSAPIASVQEKYIHETLQSHEPGSGVWVDRPNREVKVRTHVFLERDVLQSAWSGVGLTVTSMTLINGALTQERSMQPVEDPFPVLVPTGDPEADNAAYDAAKAAWINAHPEAYQLMSAPREH